MQRLVDTESARKSGTLSPDAVAAVRGFIAAIAAGPTPEEGERTWEIAGHDRFVAGFEGGEVISLGFQSEENGTYGFEGVFVRRAGEAFELRHVQTRTGISGADGGNLDYANEFLVRMSQRYLSAPLAFTPAAPDQADGDA